MTVSIGSFVHRILNSSLLIIEMIDLALFHSREYQVRAHHQQLLQRLLLYLFSTLFRAFFFLWHTRNSGRNLIAERETIKLAFSNIGYVGHKYSLVQCAQGLCPSHFVRN